MAARSKARKRALDILFEADQRELAVDSVFKRTAEMHPLNEYVQVLVDGVVSNQSAIDELIETYSTDWPLNRMPAVDRALARIGVFELVFGKSAPAGVVIDEIVTMAAELSTDDSPNFLNGLLGRIDSLKDRMSFD